VGAIGAERIALRITKDRTLFLYVIVSAASSLALSVVPSSAWLTILSAVCVQSLASSGVLVLVVAMQADAARQYPNYGHGFLYGTHSMLDKVSSGIAIVLLQHVAQAGAGSEASATDDGMAAPASSVAQHAYLVGACIVPMCASATAILLCARDALYPRPHILSPGMKRPANLEQATRQEAKEMEADILGQPLLPGHP